MAIKIGDIVLIWPYCNPEGKLGIIQERREADNQGNEEPYYVVKYIDGPDKFERNQVYHQVNDKEIRVFGSSKTVNLAAIKVLYGYKSNDG